MTRKMKITVFLLGAALVTHAADVYDDENLVSGRFFRPNVSFYNAKTLWGPFKNQKFEIIDNCLALKSLPDGKVNIAEIGIPMDYETADKLKISFLFQSGGECGVSVRFGHPLRKLSGDAVFRIPVSKNWENFSVTLRSNRDAFSGGITFNCGGKDGELKIKDLSVIPVEPETGPGKKLLLDGKVCRAVYYKESGVAETFYAREAAKLLRFMLSAAGGELIPVKKIRSEEDYKDCAVFMGRAAEESGVLTAEQIKGIGPGGYAIALKAGRLAIAGARPSGQAAGAVALLRKMGIVYLAPDQITRPSGENMELSAFSLSLNPAVPLRELNYRVGKTELLGYTSHYEMANYRMINSHCGNCHAAIDLLPLEEFQDKRPDFFALRADGTRTHTEPGKRVDTHYCMTNEDAQKILGSRLLEVMRADPLAGYFYLFPGDGGGNFCKCAGCAKLGNPTDRLLFWINRIAAMTVREFPEKKIMTLAYVDSQPPPSSQRPAENVIVLYCPYDKWLHMNIGHPDNQTAWAEMAAWEKICPKQIGAFTYPTHAEKLNIWPVFYDNVKLYRHFAEHQYRAVAYCGLLPEYASGLIPPDGSFCNMSLAVLSALLINPNLNTERAVNDYFRDYYGDAAPVMRKYFDRINAEPLKRKWTQQCEARIRGFVTQSLAEECFACLDAAEAAVAADPVRKRNVTDEKYALLWHYLTDNCRGNGKVTQANFPFYAARLAEFCKTSRSLGRKTYPSDPRHWFWNTALVTLSGKGDWYNEPVISDLIRDPEQTLGATVPLCQQKTDYGFLIPNEGILGGESSKTKWFRNDAAQVKVIRRPSSGFGAARMTLRIERIPAGLVTMRVDGIDNEKPEKSMIKVMVNDSVIYEGGAPWDKKTWGKADFPVPSGALRVGDNDIVILNTTEDTEVDGVGGANYYAKRNYTWGWFMVETVKFVIQ